MAPRCTTSTRASKMPKGLDDLMAELSTLSRIRLLEQFAIIIEPSLQKVIDFVKIVGDGLVITEAKLRSLVRNVFFRVWICQTSVSMTSEGSIIFGDGTCFTREQLELLYDNPDFVDALIKFSLSLQVLSATELGIFTTAVVLKQRHRYITDVEADVEAAKKYEDRVYEDFKVEITKNHESTNDNSPTFDISQKISEFNVLDYQHKIAYFFFRKHWREIKVPRIFATTFRIAHLVPMSENPEDLEGVSPSEIVQLQKIHLWRYMAHIYTASIQGIVKFFHEPLLSLPREDAIRLLKTRFIEKWICLFAHVMSKNSLAFGTDGFSKEQLDIIYGPNFANEMLKFSLSLQAYKLTIKEIESIGSIAFFSQTHGLIDPEGVQKLQEREIGKFNEEITKNHKYPNNLPSTFDVLQKVSELQALNLLHGNSLIWVLNNVNKVKPSALFYNLIDVEYPQEISA